MNPNFDHREFILTTSDDHSFNIPYGVRPMSAFINAQLNIHPGGNIRLENYDQRALQPVADFLQGHGLARGDDRRKRIFNDGFLLGPPEPELRKLFDALLVARDLGIPAMVDVVSKRIAGRIKDKPVEWMRATFGIQNNLPLDLEMQVRDEFPWAFEDIGLD